MTELMQELELLNQLQGPINDLNKRCAELDKSIKQSENHRFVFENHLFYKQELTLSGYLQQVKQTLSSLQEAVNKQLPKALIKHECELLGAQFQVLYNLVQRVEKGQAELLYKNYSPAKEKLYQQLQKQYNYEQRLLAMIDQEEDQLLSCPSYKSAYIKERIAALKVRYQKCNSYTQKIEFEFTEMEYE